MTITIADDISSPLPSNEKRATGVFFISILYPYLTNNFFLQIFVLFTNNDWTTGGEVNEMTGRQDYGNHINHN